MAAAPTAHFPETGIIPRKATQADAFLSENPEYNGKDVIVGIMDTGVDPGAAGLQTSPDGRPKVIDTVDCTGSGDVAMDVEREADERGTLTSLSGRTLQLNPEWQPRDGKYRLGVKRAKELLPSRLVQDVAAERRKRWDKQHAAIVDDVQSRLAEARSASPEDKERVKELEAQVAQLDKLAKEHKDPGLLYDCLLFHDGTNWRAVVDPVTSDGDLRGAKALAPFPVNQDYAPLDKDSLMNFGVNVYDGGRVLSIVCDTGSHGTHVASIVAAHHPGRPDLDGVAPGAQIVSLKIGDTRLDGMETSQGMIRALAHGVRANCDILNMSFGEPTFHTDHGRFVEVLNDVVRERGVSFISSAGNNGPALSTVGAPGSTSSPAIGVAAMVTPDMMRVEYSLSHTHHPNAYTWSSRGPAMDGGAGVHVIGLGGAIASIPNWTRARSALMNGTSMSSPNVAGCAALLCSACKATGLSWSPFRLRKALQAGAAPVPGISPLTMGAGLVQVQRSFDFLQRTSAVPWVDFSYDVSVGSGQRGIYMREPDEVNAPAEFLVTVAPTFPDGTEADVKLGMEQRVLLRADQSWSGASEMPGDTGAGAGPPVESWLSYPDVAMLSSKGKSFRVGVDPTRLPPGLHHVSISGYDVDHPEVGPVFRIPVTVLRPEVPTPLAEVTASDIRLEPGRVSRRFFPVPEGASRLDISVRRPWDATGDSKRLVAVHAVQLRPHCSYRDGEAEKFIRIAPGEEKSVTLRVHGGGMVEVALSQFWSGAAACTVSINAEFRGLDVRPDSGSDQVSLEAHRFAVRNTLRPVSVKPAATLKRLLRRVDAAHSVVALLPDAARDTLPSGKRLYALRSTFRFQAPVDGKCKLVAPLVNNSLYESPVDGQVMLVSERGSCALGITDTYPEEMELISGVAYEATLELRHENAQLLAGLKSTPIWLDTPLAKAEKLSVSDTRAKLLTGDESLSSSVLQRGERMALFVRAPTSTPKGAKAGDVLTGTLSVCNGNGGDSKAPGGYPIAFAIPRSQATVEEAKAKPVGGAALLAFAASGPAGVAAAASEPVAEAATADASTGGDASGSGSAAAPAEEGDAWRAVEEAMKEVVLKKVEEGAGKPHFPAVLAQARALYPKDEDARLTQAELRHWDSPKLRAENLGEIVRCADKVVESVDAAAVASTLGRIAPEGDEAAAKALKEAKEKRTKLTDALRRKAGALASRAQATAAEEDVQAFDDCVAALETWTSSGKGPGAVVRFAKHWLHGAHGQALTMAAVALKEAGKGADRAGGIVFDDVPLKEFDVGAVISPDAPAGAMYAAKIWCLHQLGWKHWLEGEAQWRLARSTRSCL